MLLIQNPFNINSLSFQLSFGGTVGIVVFMKYFYKEGKTKILNSIKSIIFVSICAQIAIFPIILKNFGTISISFIISNLLASPLLGIIIILGFIFILAPLNIANFVANILNLILNLLIYISKLSSNLPLAHIYMKIPSNYILILYYIMFALVVFFLNISKIRRIRIIKKIILNKYKIISIALIISIIFISELVIPKNLKIYFIDVGQRR